MSEHFALAVLALTIAYYAYELNKLRRMHKRRGPL